MIGLREVFHPESKLSEPQADTPLPADSNVQAWRGAVDVFQGGSQVLRRTIIAGSCLREIRSRRRRRPRTAVTILWRGNPQSNIREIRRPKLQMAYRERCRVGGVAHESIHVDGGEGS